jgi:hypothetical protein
VYLYLLCFVLFVLCFLYCFFYVHLFLFVLSVLVLGLLPRSENSIAVRNSSGSSSSNNNNNNNSNIRNTVLHLSKVARNASGDVQYVLVAGE